jgi:hypothetical protein
MTIMGIDLTAGYFYVSSRVFTYIDGTMGFYGGDSLYTLVDGASINFINSYLRWEDIATQPIIAIDLASTFVMHGGGLISDAGGDGLIDSITTQGFIGGGAVIELIGMDLSICDGVLFKDVGGNIAADDIIHITIANCKMHANVTVLNESLRSSGQRVLMTNSAATSAAAEYQYQYTTRGGDVNDETSIYRDNSTAYPSGQKVSLKCVTDAVASAAFPFAFDFPTRYAELSNTASDTLRIYILSSATLYDSDVWAEVIYADGTNKHEPNYLSTRHDNILDTTGTTLTTNTESWTGRTAENRYHIDIDTSTADPGADCYPTVRVYVAKTSATIYLESELVVA